MHFILFQLGLNKVLKIVGLAHSLELFLLQHSCISGLAMEPLSMVEREKESVFIKWSVKSLPGLET